MYNNMQQNQFVNPMQGMPQYGMGQPGGYQYMGPMGQQPGNYAYGAKPVQKVTQPITPELAKMLNQNQDELDIRISNTEKIRNWCTHKEPGSGRMCLIDNGDGTATCRICGETFTVVEDLVKQSEVVSKQANDILQTAKAMYIDIPEDFLKAYSQVISMLKLMPKIATKAVKNFSLYETYTGNIYQANPGVNNFQAMNNILNGFTGPMGYPQQPMGYGYGAPMTGYPQQGYMGQPMQGMPQQYPQQNGAIPMGGQVMSQPTVPQVAPDGSVMPQNYSMPNGPTTMNGMPMQGNPLVAQPYVQQPMASAPMGVNNPAPAPTGPVPTNVPVTAPATDPQQTKTMTV